MKVSADQALSAPVSSGKGNRQATDGGAETGFAHILQGVGRERTTKGMQTADAAPRQALWPDLTVKLADKAMEADTSRNDAEEPADDGEGTGGGKAQQNNAPLPNPQSLPTLVAGLPGLHRQIAATINDGDGGPTAASRQSDVEESGTVTAPASDTKRQSSDRAGSIATPLSAMSGATADADLLLPSAEARIAMPSPGKAAGMENPFPPLSTQVDETGEATSPSGTELSRNGKKGEAAIEISSPKISANAADRQSGPVANLVVTGAQSFPAPASPLAGSTIAGLTGAIAADEGARHVLSASAGSIQPTSTVALASHTLKIELHPAELGVVTASLRLSGGQLSIELKPENHEAHRKLSSDTESLVKSLQAMGFNVDKVTVLQPSVAVNAAVRAETAGTAGRDSSSFQSGNSGSNGGMSDGQQSGRNQGNDGQHGGRGTTHPHERIGGDLFI